MMKTHPYYDENSDYLDCWIYLRKNNPRKNEDIEIWDIERKVWVKQNECYSSSELEKF